MRGMDSGKRVQGKANGSGGKGKSEEAAGEREQQAFNERLTKDDDGACAEGEANGTLAAAADGADQHESGNIGADDEQHNGDCEEKDAQQWLDVLDGVLAQEGHISANVNGCHAGGKFAHHLLGDAIDVFGGLLQE